MRRTTCNNQCETTCGFKVFLKRVGPPKKKIESGREVDENLRIVDIWGDEDHPRTRGAICLKGSAGVQHAYNPIRVKYPMIREDNINGKFRRVTWDEALDFVANKLLELRKKYGPECLVAHRTGRSAFGNKQGGARFFRLFGSPNCFGQGPICCESPGVSNHYLFGAKELARLMNPSQDWINSKCIIVAGSNMAVNEVVTYKWCLDAREKNGAKIIVVDPRTNSTAGISDLHLRLRPNTDAALVLAMIHVIIKKELYDKEFIAKWVKPGDFDKLREHVKNCTPKWAEEITWVPASQIEKAAMWFGTRKPASVTGNLGTAQTYNSGNINRCYGILVTITGNIGIPGGGWNWLHNCRPPLSPGNDLADPSVPVPKRPPLTDKLAPWGDSSSPGFIEPAITGKPYPVKALIWNGNHAAQWPNSNKVRQALANMELVVHLAYHPNETCKYSHAVFPIGSMFEREGITHHGNDRSFQWHNKIIPFQWECRADVDFWAGLAKKLGEKGLEPFNKRDWFPWWDEHGYIDEAKSTDFWNSQEPLTAGIMHDLMDPEKNPVGGIYWPAMTREEANTFEEIKMPDGSVVKATTRGKWITYREDENYPQTTKRFPTLSGKIEIYSDVMGDMGWDPIPIHREASESPVNTPELAKKYPLVLCTGRLVSSFHEMGHWWPWCAETERHEFVNIHPDTAKKLGIRDGDICVVENDRGRLEIPAWVCDMTHPDMVWIPADFDREQPFYPYDNVNQLTDDVIKDPLYGQVQYKATLVRVYKKEE